MPHDDPLRRLITGKGAKDDTLPEGDDALDGLGDLSPGGGAGVTPNRERHFNRGSGRFHDPATGEFEPGSPPPDLDPPADRYRAVDGRFKKSSADLFDEEDEVLLDSLEPEG